MSTLVEYRKAVVDGLKADTGIQSMARAIQAHNGRVTLETLRYYAKKTPAVLVTVSEVEGKKQTGGAWGHVTCEVFVLATLTRSNKSRDDLALLLSGSIFKLANTSVWGLECIKRPDKVRLKNLYTDKGEEMGVSLWGVGWEQLIEITVPGADELVALEEIDVDYNIDGGPAQVDAEDLVELDQ